MHSVGLSFASHGIVVAAMMLGSVFVSHLALGGGLYLAPAETLARRKNDSARMAHLRRHGRFFLLMTILFGAAIGIGIWMTAQMLPSAGTSWLVRDFVPVWATVSVLFAVALTASLLHYYGWTRLTPKHHLIIGWIYFAAALVSLATLNGILGFLLAPVTWPETGDFRAGFFNPTFWPSLMFRIFACLTLAGLCATVTAAREKDILFKVRLLRCDGLSILASLSLAVPAGYWSITALPPEIVAHLVKGTIPHTAMQVMILAAAVLAFLTLVGTIIFPRHWGYISAGILLLCGVSSLGAFERMRQSVQQPLVLSGETSHIPMTTARLPMVLFAVTFMVSLFSIVWMLKVYSRKEPPK